MTFILMGGMVIKLKELARIRTGLVLSRKQSKQKTKFVYNQLTLKSLHADGYIDMELLDKYYSIEELKETYLSCVDDIILKLTAPYTAVLIDDTTKGMVIPSQFVIVMCDMGQISPKFIAWILNSDIAKKEFLNNNTSNMLGAIRPHFVGEIEIENISTQKQNRIGEVYVLMKKEQRLLKELKKERYIYMKTMLEKAYKE